MKRRILIVDDENVVRDFLRKLLSSAGYEVAEAADGTTALRMIESGAPSLVLLDMNMPGLSGTEVLRRALALRPGLAVIMVTGQGDEDAARQTLELGARDYVAKPIDQEYLKTSIKALLATVVEPPGAA